MWKFTLATFKSILKNKDCYIKLTSTFNWMIDCVDNIQSEKVKIDKSKLDFTDKHSFWIHWLWLVWESRDSFYKIDWWIEVYNCCWSCNILF